ncbi:uncharacterized protein ColSpa_09073 [Colletotrichum spaethianum]|uniref:Uncharacterized protein n=1 Tax=Colletotrichum spaethianum TaxID=700344 RepID=A0AA37PAY9_9PEZI|nr:uncharacterized protein ColSpa_09073 [Colletotrichum spaethianum]GKT48892.1 hypothetical protein ColSpa_09073 [Colletotrichum spaethianum]
MKSSRSSKSKSKSSSGGGGGGGSSAWSDWIWSNEYQKYYMRRTRNGQLEYHWQEVQAAQQQHAETVPREQPNVEELTNGFDNLSTSPSLTESDYSYAPQGEEGIDASYAYPTSSTPYGTSSRSRKGKETAYEDQPHDGEETQPEEPAPPLDPFWGAEQEAPQGYMPEPAAHQDQDLDSGYGTTDADGYDHNAILQEALTEAYGQESQGGPSTEPAYGGL